MRIIIALFLALHWNCLIAQFNSDTLWLHDGSAISCTIGRIGMNNYVYSTGDGYKKIKIDKVRDYSISDRMFFFNNDKEIEFELLMEVPGTTKDELYRAVKDWVWANREQFIFGDFSYTNKNQGILLGTLYSRDFYDIELINVLEAFSGEDISYYTFNYDVAIRVKNNRLKIYFSNMNLIHSRTPEFDRNAAELFRKRVNKDGSPTKNMKVILKMQKLINEQVDAIRDHVEKVKKKDTWEENTIKWFLLNDNW